MLPQTAGRGQKLLDEYQERGTLRRTLTVGLAP